MNVRLATAVILSITAGIALGGCPRVDAPGNGASPSPGDSSKLESVIENLAVSSDEPKTGEELDLSLEYSQRRWPTDTVKVSVSWGDGSKNSEKEYEEYTTDARFTHKYEKKGDREIRVLSYVASGSSFIPLGRAKKKTVKVMEAPASSSTTTTTTGTTSGSTTTTTPTYTTADIVMEDDGNRNIVFRNYQQRAIVGPFASGWDATRIWNELLAGNARPYVAGSYAGSAGWSGAPTEERFYGRLSSGNLVVPIPSDSDTDGGNVAFAFRESGIWQQKGWSSSTAPANAGKFYGPGDKFSWLLFKLKARY